MAAGERDRQNLVQQMEALLLETNAKTAELVKNVEVIEQLKIQARHQ